MVQANPVQPDAPEPVRGGTCKAHIKDICFSRMYIGGHFDAPFEDYRLDAAVFDLVGGTGVPRSALLPLTCFLHKGYLWSLNNRRLWVLRHALIFSGTDEEIDVTIIPDTSFPERKDYVTRLPFHKQQVLISPRFLPVVHGDQPKLQRLVMRPILFRFETAQRCGYRLLPGGRLLCINAAEALAAFCATAPAPLALPAPPGTPAAPSSAPRDDDTMSVHSESLSIGSMDFPGRQNEHSRHSNWSGPHPRLLNLPPVTESEREGTEGGGAEGRRGLGEGDMVQVATQFKEAVAQLRVVLDGLDRLLDTMAAA